MKMANFFLGIFLARSRHSKAPPQTPLFGQIASTRSGLGMLRQGFMAYSEHFTRRPIFHTQWRTRLILDSLWPQLTIYSTGTLL
jgi:hypothetical protein